MLFRQLQYLVALNQERHFGRAAERCHVSQPSLSSGIKQLEFGLGVPIVLRGRRFMGFTPEGDRVVEWAKRVTSQRDAMMTELSQMRNNLEGRIRIGAMPNSSPVLPFFSRIMTQQHPNVDIEIHFLGVEQTRMGLNSFALDVGITYIHEKSIADLHSMSIYTEELSLLVPESSKWAEMEQITWEEAAELPLCLLDPSMHERRIIDEAFHKIDCSPTPVVVASDSILNLIFHVMFAGLVTIVPSHFARLPGRFPGTKEIKLVNPEISREVGLVWSPSEPVMPMAKIAASITKDLCETAEMKQWFGDSVKTPA
ncbi:MAG: hypothetical protein CBB68_04360 [Rhodospirillaceae bacterium TMED8]|nr:LysR family transcriptional regulator [Magnetovibrio sp.]OUT51567.1 MAG: hypothetical protein CBB68_04360 [Rhodospirillaceae bacterium TMED8]|tara:strand:- start:661 stop:1596 length:936 start_codon:yes stop_codon:yes gene_type:complete